MKPTRLITIGGESMHDQINMVPVVALVSFPKGTHTPEFLRLILQNGQWKDLNADQSIALGQALVTHGKGMKRAAPRKPVTDAE